MYTHLYIIFMSVYMVDACSVCNNTGLIRTASNRIQIVPMVLFSIYRENNPITNSDL